jgi:hypothetical protein
VLPLADTDVVGILIAIVCVMLTFGAIGWFGTGFRLGGRRYRKLSELIADVTRITGLPGTGDEDGWFPKLDSVSWRGPLSGGRRAHIYFVTEGSGSSQTTYVNFAVDAHEVPQLKVTLETFVTKVSKFFGGSPEIEIGDKPFDDRYLLETDTPQRARAALQRSPELRDAIDRAFGCSSSTPTLEIGGRRVHFRADVSDVSPGNYKILLAALDDIAATFDRAPIKVRALGSERLAVRDRAGKTRCPYCRAGVSGDEETLTACGACRTVLHEACWEEHGGCPILGCRGTERERRRVR